MAASFRCPRRECPFLPGKALVSAADTRRRISCGNDIFFGLGGNCRKELLGQPHRAVRPPEMPGEGFRDLRDTVNNEPAWRIVSRRIRISRWRADGQSVWRKIPT